MSPRVVLKVGTSSLTNQDGLIRTDVVDRIVTRVADWSTSGYEVLLVTSAAIAAGVKAVGLTSRPDDPISLQALSAVGQSRLMRTYDDHFAASGLISGQVLITPNDFFDRRLFLKAKATLDRLLEMGVVPVVNENDAITDEAIRFGDNDRIAALVAQLIGASTLVILTDSDGLRTADPRFDPTASLVSEVTDIDRLLSADLGGAGTERGSGGMVSKIAAARIAAWSGVTTIIASADRIGELDPALRGERGEWTVVQPRSKTLSARKLWIAFGVRPEGTIRIDKGATGALQDAGSSLLAVGVVDVEGSFRAGAGVEISDHAGAVIGKGVVNVDSADLGAALGTASGSRPTRGDSPGSPGCLLALGLGGRLRNGVFDSAISPDSGSAGCF